MRVLYWHGWLLEGTGSNVYAARVAAAWRRAGHEVVLLCQQPREQRLDFVDAWGEVDAGGVALPPPGPSASPRSGVIALRPDIGGLLPVFVYDAYEGFEVKTFVDLEPEELDAYLERNVEAIRMAAAWRAPDAVITGHATAGPVMALRALGEGTYVAKVHGSDLEYAARVQERYAALAREGLEGARAVTGASRDVLARAAQLAPGIAGRTAVVPPGVDVDAWHPAPRAGALEEAAARLRRDPDIVRGRPTELDGGVARALASRGGDDLDRLAGTYDQAAPDPDAPDRLRELAGHGGPLVGYLGKLIPEKGVERFLEALALLGPEVHGVVVGFGRYREWLSALLLALHRGDVRGWRWLAETSAMRLELGEDAVGSARGLADRVTFTGRLDHRYAPLVVAAFDVLVVPSTLEEAFGMVAAEAAAAGALPLVARHSALAEVADELEAASGKPGVLSFDPGQGATTRLAEGLRRILDLPPEEAAAVRAAVRRHVVEEWTWDRTAARLLDAAT